MFFFFFRQTPTRPYSSLLQSAMSNSGGMFPGSSMLLNPMMHQMYLQMLEMQQIQQQQQQQTAASNVKPEAPAQPKIRINVQVEGSLWSLLSGSLALEVLLIGVHCKKCYINV